MALGVRQWANVERLDLNDYTATTPQLPQSLNLSRRVCHDQQPLSFLSGADIFKAFAG